ncbi:MAG: hypothetical protein DRI46_12090 [Chloroflexi bacterium]|nr:MAG: hypothetical protein DRI46_12090 [Chloroflexota bacterium]
MSFCPKCGSELTTGGCVSCDWKVVLHEPSTVPEPVEYPYSIEVQGRPIPDDLQRAVRRMFDLPPGVGVTGVVADPDGHGFTGSIGITEYKVVINDSEDVVLEQALQFCEAKGFHSPRRRIAALEEEIVELKNKGPF